MQQLQLAVYQKRENKTKQKNLPKGVKAIDFPPVQLMG